jgi:hypothetical protein
MRCRAMLEQSEMQAVATTPGDPIPRLQFN